MVRTARMFALSLAVVALAAPSLLAQAPDQALQPVPVAPAPMPPPQNNLPPIAMPQQGPAPMPQSNPFAPFTAPTAPVGNDPVPQPTIPGLSFLPQGELYASLEISLLFPELHGVLSGPVNVMGVPQTVALGSSNLTATGSPRLEVGYRLGDWPGAVAVVYRSIVSQGGNNVPNFDVLGDGFLMTRLNVNVLDIDYVSPAYQLAPEWFFSWRGGLRSAAVYYDNQVVGRVKQEQATSNFLGAGPHATIEVGRAICQIPGLAVEAKLDGAVLFGNISQSFDETVTLPSGAAFGDTTHFSHTQWAPVMTFDLGLTYTPPGCPRWARFGFGYQFEYWWDIGSGGNSRGDLGVNGLYFRGEFNF